MSSCRGLARRCARRVALGFLAAAVAASLAHAAPPAAPRATVSEARTLLAKLVAIDTTQAGSTRPAVELVAAYLRANGFAEEDVAIVGPRDDRMNLFVRFRAPRSAQRKPILWLAHLDVVAANAEDWSVPPFELTDKDGFLYGRGTIDVKGEAAILAVTLARLKREGFRPARDVCVALTADEEEGSYNGVEWLLANRRDWLDAAYAINTDAGGLQQQGSRFARFTIQTSEKLFLTFALETRGAGGHSSMPARENAIHRLAAALARLDDLEFPVRLDATTRAYFARLARIERGELAAAFRGVLAEPPDPAAVDELSATPRYNATLRTTCTPTMLSAGHAENALPERASAKLQCRLLPGDDAKSVQAAIEARIADPRVTVTPLEPPVIAPASPLRRDVFRAVEGIAAKLWPGVPVLPVMDVWTTDGARLRRDGIPVYGFAAIHYDLDDYRGHASDERIVVSAFEQGLEFSYAVLRKLASNTAN
jgi:acetylornithine deacetylase/succinyl-diaminopimelate desuccinylase-like protein